MRLSRSEIDHVARLAHIGLDPEEIEGLATELSSVIDHVNRLREIDTEGIEPTAHIAELRSVLRDDLVRPSWNPLAVLANAPRAEESQFVVQAVLD